MGIQWLLDKMRLYSDKEAIIWKDRPFTYNYLLERKAYWARNLVEHKVASGEVVIVEGDYSPSMCALFLTLIENNNILVPLTSASATNREKFIRIAEGQKLFKLDYDENFNFTDLGGEPIHPLIKMLQTEGNPGLVLFSSGSTGEPKAALHNFDKLLDKFKVTRPALRTITFLLLDHIGGINTMFHTLSNGGCVITAQDRSPEYICHLIEKHKVQVLPTSPTFLNLLLLSEQYKSFNLSSLQTISYGTEPMPESTLKRLNEIFPDVRFIQTYGLSELGILRSKSKSSSSLWVSVGGEGYQTRVVDGILHIKAESAMLGYLNAPSPFDEDGWFNTEDEVEVDGEYIRIKGRKSDIINVGGQKVYPAEVESVLLEMDNIADAVVTGEPNAIMGNIVIARVVLNNEEDAKALTKRVKSYCRERLSPYKIPVKVEIATGPQFNERYKRKRGSDSQSKKVS